MFYSRIKNNIVHSTVLELYPIEINVDDYWISHDNENDFVVGSIYLQQPKIKSAWGATSMDNEPVTFITNKI